jgi:hypothetical protein
MLSTFDGLKARGFATRTCPAMSKAPTKAPADARSRAVRRLSAVFGWSIVLQAGGFLVLAWGYRALAQLILDFAARAAGGQPSATAEGIAGATIVLLDLFVALLAGFVGARWLLRAIVRATPHPMKPPTRPIPLASLCAGAVVATVSILVFVARSAAFGSLWANWSLELLRDAAIVALFWFASRRVLDSLPPA